MIEPIHGAHQIIPSFANRPPTLSAAICGSSIALPFLPSDGLLSYPGHLRRCFRWGEHFNASEIRAGTLGELRKDVRLVARQRSSYALRSWTVTIGAQLEACGPF